MISDALTPTTSYVTLPTDQINYMRNSVKAVVDAYDGEVDALRVGRDDPMLEAWTEIFPGVVQPRDDDPRRAAWSTCATPRTCSRCSATCSRSTTSPTPQDFYKGTDRWEVPEDPAEPASKQPPYRLSVQMPADEDTDADGPAPTQSPVFSLTSVYVPTNRANLASFIAVDSDATERRLRADPDPAAAGLHAGAGPVADREHVRGRRADPDRAAADQAELRRSSTATC